MSTPTPAPAPQDPAQLEAWKAQMAKQLAEKPNALLEALLKASENLPAQPSTEGTTGKK